MARRGKSLISLLLMSWVASSNAGSFQSLTSESIGVEAASSGELRASISGDSIVLRVGTTYKANDRISLSVSGDALFSDSTYTLEQSAGGAGTGNLSEFILTTAVTSGASWIEFKAANDIPKGAEFLLSGSAVAGQSVSFAVPLAGVGDKILLSAAARDVIGTYDSYEAVELFRYAHQFAAYLSQVADASLGAPGSFASDVIQIEIEAAPITNGVSLDDNDIINVVLSGDMSNITAITAQSAGVNVMGSIAPNLGSATLSLSGSDIVGAGGSIPITLAVDQTKVLSERTFTLQSIFNFQHEQPKVLIPEGTFAGDWTGGDTDGDGVRDSLDAFPDDPAAAIDTDLDGRPDDWLGTATWEQINNSQLVTDDDDDNDGVVDELDPFPLDASETADSDGDGVGDNTDNCAAVSNADQQDSDADGIGDVCDNDKDNDGYDDIVDAFPQDPSEWYDTDLDGVGNNQDFDDDGDGIIDSFDPSPTEFTEVVVDADGDGIVDAKDPDSSSVTAYLIDSDGDGIPDALDDYPDDPDNAIAPSGDFDKDGFSNQEELDFCSNPLSALSQPEFGGLSPALIKSAIDSKNGD